MHLKALSVFQKDLTVPFHHEMYGVKCVPPDGKVFCILKSFDHGICIKFCLHQLKGYSYSDMGFSSVIVAVNAVVLY